MAVFACDLHIHSTLSPCGSLEMSPKNILEQANATGLNLIAITDHNMTENSFHVRQMSEKYGLTVLPGMELQTREEIHLLSIFDDFETAFEFQNSVYELLPDVHNDVDFFGDQVVVDADENIVRIEERLLLNSAQISIEDAVAWIKSRGGLAIPSHIDSATNSIIGQLGFVPDGIPFDALEIRHMEKAQNFAPLIMVKDVPLVSFSDAHYLKDIGIRRTLLDLEEPTCKEIARALKLKGKERDHLKAC